MADAFPIPTHHQFQDLTGRRFTRWQVVSYAGRRGAHHYWNCVCDCGATKAVAKNSLTASKSLSCGCIKVEQLAERRFIDVTGSRFGRLVALGRAESSCVRTMWLCQCDCGALATVDGSSLRRGATSSCGCFLAEVRPFNFRSHGRSKTPEWRAWVAMRKRCSNPKDPGYAYYGGRGIYVCDEWKESFQAFYNAMGPRPSDSHSIDRFPDNDGPYAPWNCRWATKSQQAYNRRPKGA